MAKEFYFKGKTIEELKAMPEADFMMLVNSRARRSLKKGQDKALMKKVKQVAEVVEKGGKAKTIRTHRRDTVVTPEMVGMKFGVHNGKEFVTLDIEPEMLGHYFGEYVLTRKRLIHGKAGIGATKSSKAVTAR